MSTYDEDVLDLDDGDFCVHDLTVSLPPQGIAMTINLLADKIINKRIALPDCSSWSIPALTVEKASYGHGGFIGTISELLEKAIADIEFVRGSYSAELQPKFDTFIVNVQKLLYSNDLGFFVDGVALHIRDPAGVATIDNMKALINRGVVQMSHFNRNWSEESDLGLTPSPTILEDEVTPEFVAEHLLNHAKKIVVFTGAGASVESGISPFRMSDDAVWEHFDPHKMTVQNFNASPDIVQQWWAVKRNLYGQLSVAQPNACHTIWGNLHSQGRLHGIITQNIDGLHTHGACGVPEEKVLELHGSLRRGVICANKGGSFNLLPCGDGTCTFHQPMSPSVVREYYETNKTTGYECPLCGSAVRTETVLFGQPIPPEVLANANQWVQECDLLVCIGTSLLVSPACELPAVAARRGVPILIFNLHNTQYDSHAYVVKQPAGHFLEKVREHLH